MEEAWNRLRREAEPGGLDGPPVRLPNDPEDEDDTGLVIPDPEPPRVWEKTPEETSRSFDAFRAYRDLGPLRTLAQAAVQFYAIPDHILQADPDIGNRYAPRLRGWYQRFQWKVRAEAFDQEVDRRRWQSKIRAVEAMNETYIDLAASMRNKALVAVSSMDPGKLLARDIPGWVKAAMELERTAYGIGGQHHTLQITGADGGPIQHNHNIDEAAVDDRIAELLRGQGLTVRAAHSGRSSGALPSGEAGASGQAGEEGAGGGDQPPEDYQDSEFTPADYR